MVVVVVVLEEGEEEEEEEVEIHTHTHTHREPHGLYHRGITLVQVGACMYTCKRRFSFS
jgi:hypothetical protein